MQMFAKFIQNFQQGQYTENNPTGTKVTGKEKKRNNFGTNYIPNNLRATIKETIPRFNKLLSILWI